MPRRSVVRSSKFRHVFGEPYKRDKCYENVDITKNVWDGGNYCAVNSKFVAIVLERSGGAFLVLPAEKTGRIDQNHPKYYGHKGRILDLQFNPFNANVIASAGEDSRIKIWKLPEEEITEDVTECTIDLIGHRKKVGIIQWHPTANNVLASAGFDLDIILWDVENGSPVNVISCHGDVINSMCWNFNGSMLATSCKDKLARVIDPRTTNEEERVVHSFSAHEGSKPFRVHFVDDKRIVTVGTKKTSDREIALWNTTDLTEPITRHELDQGSGNMLSMYDSTLNLLYAAAKGDCNIKYFEISKESPYVHYLSQYQAATSQRGFGLLPKRALSVNKCEVFRLYKLDSKGLVEPVSMVVPRKSDCFQQDIYPNVPGDSPALQAGQWFGGDNADPILISLQDGFVATRKEFNAVVNTTEENIFAVNLQSAPQREEDLKKSFYQQQDELRNLRELLKGKELKIRQLEYENISLKKKTGDTVVTATETKTNSRLNSSMIAEDSDCSDASSDDNHQADEIASQEIKAC